MAGTISFDGLATGINATETVDKLMEVEGRPKILKEAEKTRYENEQAAWREVNTKLLTLRDSTQQLWRSSTWSSLKIATTNSGVLTAATTASAKEGTYTLSVEQLALNGQKISKAYNAKTDLIGEGTLDVTIGGVTKNIDVTASDTVSTLADKINALDLAVTASMVKDGATYKLLISSDKTGLANDVTLGGSVAPTLATTTVQAAQDAKIKFGTDDGLNSTAATFTSSTNKMDGIIDGVTLNLISASPGEAITLTTSRDTSAVEDDLQTFVDSYNDMLSYVNTLTDYNQEKKLRGVLQADSTVRTITDRLRSLVANTVGAEGVFKTLRSVGIEMQDDGTLKLDSTKVKNSLTEDYSAVENLFRKSAVGLAPRMDGYLKDLTSPIIGLTDKKISSFDATITKTVERIADMDERLKAKREMLMAKFVKMESAVKSFNTQSGFLTSQLSGLNKNWG